MTDGCFRCSDGLRPRPYTGFQWPNAEWRPLGIRQHTLHYQRGPVPWVEVRPRGDAASVLKLFLGDTLTLDCTIDYEVRAATDAADVSLNQPASSSGPVTVRHDIDLVTDMEPQYKGPGLLRYFWNVLVASTDANSAVLNVSVEGLRYVVVHMESQTGFGAGLTVTPQVRFDPAGDVSSQPVLPAAFTAAGQYQRVLYGEVARFTTTFANRFEGLVDRMTINMAGSGTLTGTIAISILGGRYDR